MTREHKLALIVGFSLVLVVGVLISDHFSRARTSRVADDLAYTPVDQIGTSSLPPTTGGGFTPPALADAGRSAPIADPLPFSEPPRQSVAGPIAEFTMGSVSSSVDLAGAIDDALRDSRATPPEPVSAYERLQPAVQTGPATVRPDPLASQVIQPPDAGRSTGRAAAEPAAPPSGGRLSSGALRRHEVVRGDNLSKITARYYGDGRHWKRLQAFNADRVDADGGVRVGTTLLIPPADVLMGEATLPTAAKAAAPAPSKPAPAAPAPATYTVQKGDTLGKIAQSRLGSGGRWREIFELNRDQLNEADSIRPGMTLRLPPR